MSNLFTNETGEPYNFYLTSALRGREDLVEAIKSHGGRVVEDTQEMIVLGDGPNDVDPELADAYIYSYHVVFDSIKQGALMSFGEYLIRVPNIIDPALENQKDQGQQVDHHQDDQMDPYHMELIDDAVSSNKEWLEETEVHSTGPRYFTKEESDYLIEEVRKRPWMGLKGHMMYNEISRLPYFVQRMRSADSLRERMRTLNFDVGYVYKTDRVNKHRLLVDKDGNYIRTAAISKKANVYTVADDLILCKTIYKQLTVEENIKGFEVVEIPSSFYNKYSLVYTGHSKESYRQRLKKFIIPFGIKNYLKYYIKCIIENEEPKPVNTANVEWLNARRQYRELPETDIIEMYYPDVPVENEWIDNNWQFTKIEGEVGVVFENTLARKTNLELQDQEGDETSGINSTDGKTNKISYEEVEAYLSLIGEGAIPDKELNDDEFHQEIYEIFNGQSSSSKIQEHVITQQEAIEIAENNKLKFVDEPTTKIDPFYVSFSHGKPAINLDLIENKEDFKAQVLEITQRKSFSMTQLSDLLTNLHIMKYYSLFLIFRCNNDTENIYKCICNYVETNGEQKTIAQPGVWTTKSIEWLTSDDNDKKLAVEKYHGAASSSQVLKTLEIKRDMEKTLALKTQRQHEKRLLESSREKKSND